MLPEELARQKIDKQLLKAGWHVIDRDEYTPIGGPVAVRETLMQGNKESDYLLFIDNKAIAVLEAKEENNSLGSEVEKQAEEYAHKTLYWTGKWFSDCVPLVYLANGKKILFRNLLDKKQKDYVEVSEIHTPKKMLTLLNLKSEYGALPYFEQGTLRTCQYDAQRNFEESLRSGSRRALSVLATGSGKTYLACLASYRMLTYTNTKKVLFLVDRNNLAKQTVEEFAAFNLTENKMKFSEIYQVAKLRGKETDKNAAVIVSTIQKLFAFLTGQTITDEDDYKEDDTSAEDDDKPIKLDGKLTLPPDFFQFIIVDECHRSIYGKWKAVLDYFSNAVILGLTATPIEETYSFFNKNVIENYTYEQSVVDGVNVPVRVYDITTQTTAHGNQIKKNETVQEISHLTGEKNLFTVDNPVQYDSSALDKMIVDTEQIEFVIRTFKEKIYSDLFPTREPVWEYIPKTLIFAKDENHATNILNTVKKIFGEEFTGNKVPENFARKITYTADNPNGLIEDLRIEKDFRIAVTVTLVATGTDVKPLEVVLFMTNVKSPVLYTQMKGRGCRSIGDDKLKEITPNADTKSCFFLVDAVGVTKTDKPIREKAEGANNPKKLSLKELLEHLAHGEYSDVNLTSLRDYCSSIHARYEYSQLFVRHLTDFIAKYGFAPRALANKINNALEQNILPPFDNSSESNTERHSLISELIDNINARTMLLELHKGYTVINSSTPDVLLHSGFSQEEAKEYIWEFEKYLDENKDRVEALRIIYNSEDITITHSMLEDLRDKLLAENRLYTPYTIWTNYRIVNKDSVDELDLKTNINCLTNLMQIVRFVFKKSERLTSLYRLYAQRFSLFCGQAQRVLTESQKSVMKQIADYIIDQGAISMKELNIIDTNLWRKGQKEFKSQLSSEISILTKFILKVA